MDHWPAGRETRKDAFGKALKKIRKELLQKAGHEKCPYCGRDLNGASGGIIHTGNRDGVAVRQAGANPASPPKEPRFTQPPEELAEIDKMLATEEEGW